MGAIAVFLLLLDVQFGTAALVFNGQFDSTTLSEIAKIVLGVGLGYWSWVTGKREARAKVRKDAAYAETNTTTTPEK